jgi:hypothetical protein
MANGWLERVERKKRNLFPKQAINMLLPFFWALNNFCLISDAFDYFPAGMQPLQIDLF